MLEFCPLKKPKYSYHSQIAVDVVQYGKILTGVIKTLAALGFQVLGRSLCGNPCAVFASVRWVNYEYKTFSSGFDSDTR